MAVEKDNILEDEQKEKDSDKEVDVEVVDTEQDSSEPPVENIQEQLVQKFYQNLASEMDDRVLTRIASQLISDFKKDKESRQEWEKSYISGLDLLGFKYSEDGQPFRGASGVTHPLLSEAVTQFQAQAYKELLPSDGPVKTQIVGERNFAKEEQAQRVQEFMNYMLMDQMEEYTPDFDQLLFYLPLTGSSFKKVYYDDLMQRPVSKFIPAEDLVVPYYATDLKDCERITHVIKMSENDLLKKQRNGFYRDIEVVPSRQDTDEVEEKYQQMQGINQPSESDYQFNILEMHVDLDLEEFEIEDAPKNVRVPYIVTIDEGSQQVLSIIETMNPLTKRINVKNTLFTLNFYLV